MTKHCGPPAQANGQGFTRLAMMLRQEGAMSWAFLIATSSEEQHGYKAACNIQERTLR